MSAADPRDPASSRRRRRLLQVVPATLAGPLVPLRTAHGTQVPAPPSPGAPFPWAPVLRDPPMRFPADFGAHPAHRTEWWYVTGWLDGRAGEAAQGVQITFFRSRTGHSPANPSRFAPHQLLFAHAAVARPAVPIAAPAAPKPSLAAAAPPINAPPAAPMIMPVVPSLRRQ